MFYFTLNIREVLSKISNPQNLKKYLKIWWGYYNLCIYVIHWAPTSLKLKKSDHIKAHIHLIG